MLIFSVPYGNIVHKKPSIAVDKGSNWVKDLKIQKFVIDAKYGVQSTTKLLLECLLLYRQDK